VRKFSSQWVNLNSLLPKPKPITNTYLSLFLKQLQIDGYSIFIITGTLPDSQADIYLKNNPLPNSYFVDTTSSSKRVKDSQIDETIDADNDANLQVVLEKSYLDSLEDENHQLQMALEMSLENKTDK